MTGGQPVTGPGWPPGAVLFDIDGTLVDSNYLHVDAWLRALQAVYDDCRALLRDLDASPLAAVWS